KARTEHIKAQHLAEYVGLAGMLITSLPIPIQAVALPYAGMLPISLSNMICTNVPGPQVPLYFMGHKMLTWYPHVPIGGEMGINTAVLTYNGTAYFGFTADMHAAPDAELFEKLLPESFAEFCDTLGLKPLRKPASRRSKKASGERSKQQPKTKQREPSIPTAAGH
ncbi:MAG TPA: WS/DGAT domain-containing protein, partial [Terriglobales bacterium]|nr:WS/DGAT domain-containing protein [Terriglobales bacterium]